MCAVAWCSSWCVDRCLLCVVCWLFFVVCRSFVDAKCALFVVECVLLVVCYLLCVVR